MTVKPCLGCHRNTTNGSRCAACQQAYTARRDASRGTRQQRGYDAEWYRLVKIAIANHPYCSVPGCADRDLTGDHFIPIAQGGARSYDNIQVLCRHHNSQKGASGRRGWGV